MNILKALSMLVVATALISLGTWAGWSARAKADTLLDTKACTEKAIDTLIFWK